MDEKVCEGMFGLQEIQCLRIASEKEWKYIGVFVHQIPCARGTNLVYTIKDECERRKVQKQKLYTLSNLPGI